MSQFQTQVNQQPAPAVAGDFASANPRASVLAGPGSLVAGPAGVTVGLFAWAASNAANDPSSGETDFYNTVSNFGTGAPTGFVHREQQALITQFLGAFSSVVPVGCIVTLHSAGDFWVKNTGTGSTAVGQKVYANNSNGAITTGATGNPPTGASVTATIQQNQCTVGSIAINQFNGSIAGTTLTVTNVITGALAAGETLSGTNIAAGTTVISQLSGTLGGVGTYQLSIGQTVVSGTITASGGTFTLSSGTVIGYFAAGQTLSGTGVSAGQTILSQISGTAGGIGTYAVSIAQTVNSETITASGALLNVSAVASGSLGLNDLLSGTGVVAGTHITAFITGAGNTGNYLLDTAQNMGASTVTVLSATETKWLVMSAAGPGELFKMSSWPLG